MSIIEFAFDARHMRLEGMEEKKMAPKKGHTLADYVALANDGHSKSEAARILGVKVETVHRMAVRHNINFVMGYIAKEKRDATPLSKEDIAEEQTVNPGPFVDCARLMVVFDKMDSATMLRCVVALITDRAETGEITQADILRLIQKLSAISMAS